MIELTGSESKKRDFVAIAARKSEIYSRSVDVFTVTHEEYDWKSH